MQYNSMLKESLKDYFPSKCHLSFQHCEVKPERLLPFLQENVCLYEVYACLWLT